MAHSFALPRTVLVGGLLLAAILGACGRDFTGVGAGQEAGLTLVIDRPGAKSLADEIAPVDRVRLHLVSAEPPLVVTRVIPLTPGVDSSQVRLSVPLPSGAGRGGLPMTLTMQFISPSGDTLFRGGPVPVLVSLSGAATSTPTVVPPVYVGPGANAASVELLPASGSAIGGGTTAFTAVAFDGQGQPIANTPVSITAPDLDGVTTTGSASATVTWVARRGTARVVASLLTGPADTVVFQVTPPANRIVRQSGDGQSAQVNVPLGAPLVVRALAADNGPVAGLTIAFAVATGGGALSGPTAVTDANGDASVNWTLGPTPGTQTVTASAPGLTAITFSAVATTGTSLGRIFTSNVDASTISVINATNGARVTLDCTVVIATCSEPRNPAINPAGTLIAVPFRFSGAVLLIDPALPNYVNAVSDPSFNEPYAVAFTADGSQLWIANKFGGGSDTGTVSVVDVATRTLIATVTDTSFGSPEGIVIAGGRAFVANRGKPTLTIIDVATRNVVGRVLLNTASRPRHVVATPDGQFVYASTSRATLEKVNVATGLVVAEIAVPGFGSSRNLAVRPDGAFVYAGMQNAGMAVVNVSSNAASVLTFTGANSIYGVTILRDGTIGVVSDESQNVVRRFDPLTNTELVEGGFPATTGFTPRGIIGH
jgi:DNA-binding beta-propeller fold protein YncE